jgi:peptide/nickel transport system substrate-binding protein
VVGYNDYQEQKADEISGIKILDDYQLQINLKDSYAPFIYNLVNEAAVVIPERAAVEANGNFSLNPIGTGPFKFNSFGNSKIQLTKNQNYWQNTAQQNKLPYLDQIEYYFNNNKDLNGNYKEFDLYQLNYDQLIEYYHNKQTDENYNLKTVINNNLYFVAFDCRENYLKENEYKIIKNKIKSNLNIDKLNRIIKLNDFSYTENMNDGFNFLNKISANNKAAEKELKLTGNLQFKIISNNSNFSLKTIELLKTEFNKFGMKLEVENYNWSQYLKHLKNNYQKDLFIMSYSYENKFDFIADNFYSESEKNYFNYENRRIDNLIDYIKLTKNRENQDKAYAIIEEILLIENPYLVIFKGIDNFLISKKLMNQEIFKNIHTKDSLELLYFK